jgi:hypothetical protein
MSMCIANEDGLKYEAKNTSHYDDGEDDTESNNNNLYK